MLKIINIFVSFPLQVTFWMLILISFFSSSPKVSGKIEDIIHVSAPISFKRLKKPQGDSLANESKRRRENPSISREVLSKEENENCNKEESLNALLRHKHLSNSEKESKDLEVPKVLRSQSENQLSVIKTVSISSDSNEKFTGNFSQPQRLPTVQSGKHPDIKSISVHTMAALLRGEYDNKIASFKVLDCRYPYEYEGGHIRNAINWPNLNMVKDYLDAQEGPPNISTSESPRPIHIFHCEFSAERGPRALRFLREVDRTIN